MFKIIAALKGLAVFIARLSSYTERASNWVQNKLYRASDALYDLRERVTGAALSASAEALVANNARFANVKTAQIAASQQATIDLEADLRKAHENYSASLKVIGTLGDAQRKRLNDKAVALRVKHTKLRGML